MRFATTTEEHPPFEFRSPHGVGKMGCQSRYWNGIAVRHVVQYLGPGRVWHDLSSKDPTVAILLEQVGGYCDSRLNVNRPTPRTRFDAGHTVFVPAEMSVWGYSDGIESTRDLRLSFNANAFASIHGAHGASVRPLETSAQRTREGAGTLAVASGPGILRGPPHRGHQPAGTRRSGWALPIAVRQGIQSIHWRPTVSLVRRGPNQTRPGTFAPGQGIARRRIDPDRLRGSKPFHQGLSARYGHIARTVAAHSQILTEIASASAGTLESDQE